MKYDIKTHYLEPIDEMFLVEVKTLPANETLGEFVDKLAVKIGVFFGNHAAYREYIRQNLKLFDDLNPDALVRTVMPADLSLVGNAIEHINDGLEKLKVGEEIELPEFCNDTLERVGIVLERGRISVARFTSGNWGEGKDKDGIDHPMTYSKKVSEFKWNEGASVYANRFIKLAETQKKNQLIAASKRHYVDVRNAMARGLSRDRAVFNGQVAIDQINQINVCRNMLIKFYFGQLCEIMKGAFVQPIGEKPKEMQIPNTWIGK